MKIGGIIILVIGALNFLIAIIGIVQVPEYSKQIGTQLSSAIMFIALGIFMISRANKKKIESDEKNKWNNNEN
jgi:multisubunit Na+/H+ antiporter MnhG subunit